MEISALCLTSVYRILLSTVDHLAFWQTVSWPSGQLLWFTWFPSGNYSVSFWALRQAPRYWIYISFGIISIFGTSPAWQSSKLTFAWNAVGRSCFGEVDHGRRQKPLPAMRACEQKQNPMLWFVWRVRQLQRWAALFLSMAGRSCLLRYSWLGENSNLFERRVGRNLHESK
jgi:hypothetical protein